MANEKKLTTVGQMRTFASRQDARDDTQDEQIRQLDEENDTALHYTSQTLTPGQKEQARANIGAAAADHDHNTITNEEISAIFADNGTPVSAEEVEF